jgi:gliding motility-associated-like protein
MRKFYFLWIAFLLMQNTIFAQTKPDNSNPQHNGDGTTNFALPVLKDGSNTLGLTYNQTLCGLNYVQASAMTTTRYSPPGTGLPVSLTISGIPACAVIQQAYLYWIASNSSNDAGFTINGTPGTGTMIGSGPDKCWSMGATNHFRANVTANVTGNGTYTANVNSGANATDGVTLLVIYTDPSATYRGTMIIHDGCIVNTSGGVSSYNMTGINACGAGTNVSAFLIMGDNQDNISPPTHTVAAGAASGTFNNNFYNFDVVSPAVPSGLASLNYSNTPGGGDCYSIIAAGLYFRTTTCGACTTGALTLTTSQTADNCSLCNGTASVSATGGSGTYSYTWSPAPGGGQGTATATGLCAGTYSVTVSDGGCNTQTATVTVTSTGTTPNTTITPAGPFCQTDAAVNLSAATAGGTWSGTGITNSTNGTFNPATAGPGTHTITYAIGGPCGGSSTTTITVNALTTPTFTAIAPICSGGSITLPTTSNNGITGTWSPAINNTATTTYTFTPNAGQCASTTTMSVTVNPAPTMTTPANIAACPSDNVAASAFTSTPAGASFTWTNSNTAIGLGASGSGNTPSFSATNGTGSPITGTITVTPSLSGCTGTPVTYTITVNDLFDATITPAGPFCETDAAVNLTAVDAGGTWSGTGITNASSGTFDPSIAGAGTFTITYSISGSCGSTDTENITVNPIPVVNSITNITACPGDAIVASVFSSTPAGASYTWTNDNTTIGLGASGTGNTPGFTAVNGTGSSISGNVSVIPTLNGCVGLPVTYSITINDQFDATITPAGPFCESNTNTFLAAVDPGGAWSGNGIVNTVTGEFSPSAAGAGTHTITYTILGSCGDVQTTSIQVIADADATINSVGPFCVSDPIVTLTAAQNGGVWSGTGITSAANGTFDPSVAGAGTHTIDYNISGVCGDNDQITITVVDLIPSTINPAGPFCADDASVTLTAANTGGTWSGTGITNTTNGTFDPAVAGAGTHTITYTISGSCGTTSTLSITVNPLPVPIFVADISSGCAPLTVTFTDNTSPAGVSSIWSNTDGFISSNNGGYTYTFTTPGTYGNTLTLTDANGCTGTTIVNNMINVFANPVADFTWGPTDATIVNPTIYFSNTSTGADLYLWDFGGIGTSTSTHPSFAFPDTSAGSYQVCLVAETINGCLDTTCQLIEINDEFLLYVPNAFTPDGDNINDVFNAIINGHEAESFEMMIFNRWGDLIFQSQHDNVGWDGTHKGLESKEDVYVWKIQAKRTSDGKKLEFIGHVSLLR